MYANALGAPSHSLGNRDLDVSCSRLPDAPQLCCTLVAQEGVFATGQHGGHPTFEVAYLTSAKHENPTMKGAESSSPEAVVDGPVREAELAELGPRDHSVLPSGKGPGQTRVLVTLPRDSVVK